MYKYLLFIVFGIILYLFLNGVERFLISGGCTDLPDEIGNEWREPVQPHNNCRVYERNPRWCDLRADAKRHCCVCGGGCTDLPDEIGNEWREPVPPHNNCRVYERNPRWCDLRADAKRHCCVCGGGASTGSTFVLGTDGDLGGSCINDEDCNSGSCSSVKCLCDDQRRCYEDPVDFLRRRRQGGATGGGACSAINTKQKLMDSYKVCDSSIRDDILSQLRCAYDSNDVDIYRSLECDPKDIRCHSSMGIFQDPWLEKIYNITEDIFGESDFNGWFEFGQYLNSGNHYLASLTTSIHSFVLEFKNKQFRILSSWDGENSFFDFPPMSIWGNFDGHPDWDSEVRWDEFTRLMTILNGGPLLNQYGSKITTLPSNDSTWTWTEDELRESGEIYNTLFSVPVDMQQIIDTKISDEPGRRRRGNIFITYPKGKVIKLLRVFLQMNGLK
jgi:hypothetical protein